MTLFGNKDETASEESPESELAEILKKILLESEDIFMLELEKVNKPHTV